MTINPKEWLIQTDYDMETAEYMFQGGRYFYAVFICHLAIEKALKGVVQKIQKEIPPKTHNLIYLLNKVNIRPPEKIGRFLVKLNQSSVVTRYPEDLGKLQKEYNEIVVQELLCNAKETIKWIKTLF